MLASSARVLKSFGELPVDLTCGSDRQSPGRRRSLMRRRAGRSLSTLRGALATAAYANDNQIDSRKYIIGASMTRAFVITSFVRRPLSGAALRGLQSAF
jgi:hypothetical protein